MDDRELVSQMLKRDKRALATFYKRYAGHLSRFIHSKVSNKEDSEELLQDTFFAFLEAIRDFHGDSSVKTFLFSICHHKIIDYYRRKKFRHIVFSQMPQLEALISPLLSPEEVLDEKILREKIQTVFQKLLPRYRQILKLKYLEQLSVEEIALSLSISFKSAESQLFRARKAFVSAFVSL